MTKSEWLEIAAGIRAKWPHVGLPDVSLAQYFADLSDLPGEQVGAAVEVLYRDGREFPPNGAQIRRRLAELATGAPDFGPVWSLVMKAVGRFGRTRAGEAIAFLEDAAGPVAAEFVRELGWTALCCSNAGDSTVQAQARHKYEALIRRSERDVLYAGIPVAGLPGLDVVRQRGFRSGPERLEIVVAPVSEVAA